VAVNSGRRDRFSKEFALNKRKKVAWRKHRVKAKKLEEKRRMSTLARRR
jgi:hypothetical protein